ncbi:MAG: tRNA (adenosine(37)-N6)-dimethylallyltransferase [Angelakisella sp.]
MRLKPNTLIVVAGPTASGKTALAIQIAKAVDGEIVSADSMQIYRGVDIATAKPTPEELAAVPHHLIGFLPMDRAFSVADYAELARKEINDILSRGKVPVLCGGTGLYIKAIVDNVQYSEAITGDEALRSGCGSWRSGRAMMPCGGGWKQWTPKRPSASTPIMWAGSSGPLR